MISQTCLSCFALGSSCLCKGRGIDDTKVLVENHHLYLSSKTSLCDCVKSFFYKIDSYFNAGFVMSCTCIGDIINNFSIF